MNKQSFKKILEILRVEVFLTFLSSIRKLIKIKPWKRQLLIS